MQPTENRIALKPSVPSIVAANSYFEGKEYICHVELHKLLGNQKNKR